MGQKPPPVFLIKKVGVDHGEFDQEMYPLARFSSKRSFMALDLSSARLNAPQLIVLGASSSSLISRSLGHYRGNLFAPSSENTSMYSLYLSGISTSV
jgi:hypothetical protein